MTLQRYDIFLTIQTNIDFFLELSEKLPIFADTNLKELTLKRGKSPYNELLNREVEKNTPPHFL